MDIENTWQQSEGNDEVLSKLLQQNDFNNLPSRLPLKKLKDKLKSGMIWAGLITIVYISMFFFVSVWQVVIPLCILIIFNSWIMIESWKLYKNTNENISASFSVKQELQKNYDSFQKWSSLQLKVSLFVFPIAVAGGFVLGGIIGSGKTVESFLNKPKIWMFLCGTIVALVPAAYFLAKWMFKISLGKHLKNLKILIDELSD